MNGLRMLWRGFTLLWIITLGSVAMAAPLSADGTIEIDQPWARIAPNEDGTISVFFEVVSRGEKDDSLISATSRHAKTSHLRRGKWHGLDFINKKPTASGLEPGNASRFIRARSR